jgi:hypothetical protein
MFIILEFNLMKEKRDKIDRRNFLKAMGTAGMASAFVPLATGFAAAKDKATETTQKPKVPQVPRRVLGKTKVKIPCLSFGTFQVDVENQILLRKTLQWGINFWDTAYSYAMEVETASLVSANS